MSAPVHFYLTFNPFLNSGYEHEYTQAHEFHDLLLEEVEKNKEASVFWGKMIGSGRKSDLDIGSFQKEISNNAENGESTHLYITDFQNIWVTKVKAVTNTIPKEAKTLSFYEGKKVEVWFEITDMTLLEHNHEETANKLSELYIDNQMSNLTINGLSPFTTGIKYPCFIQDLSEEQYFDELDTDEFSHFILKPNAAVNTKGADHILRCIHTYAIHETMYKKLPHAAKIEIESAEIDMMEQRRHNVGRISFGYLKALEIIMNDLIIGHIKRNGFANDFFVDTTCAPPKLFINQTKDYYIPLKQFHKNFSINAISHFVDKCNTQNSLSFKKAFSEHKQFIKFMTGDLQKIIKENDFIGIRNKLAHNDGKIEIHDAMAIRNLILGVGCKGIINMAYQCFYPELYKPLIKVQSEPDKKSSAPIAGKLKLVG